MSQDSNEDINLTSNSFAPPTASTTSLECATDTSNVEPRDSKAPSVVSGGDLGNLFSITRELHAIENALIESSGEFPAELEARLSTAVIAREKKVDAYHAILERCASLEAEYKARADFFTRTARAANATARRLKTSLKEAMQFLSVMELEGGSVRFKLSNSKPAVEISDEAGLPLEYLEAKTVYVPNKQKLLEALQSGVE